MHDLPEQWPHEVGTVDRNGAGSVVRSESLRILGARTQAKEKFRCKPNVRKNSAGRAATTVAMTRPPVRGGRRTLAGDRKPNRVGLIVRSGNGNRAAARTAPTIHMHVIRQGMRLPAALHGSSAARRRNPRVALPLPRQVSDAVGGPNPLAGRESPAAGGRSTQSTPGGFFFCRRTMRTRGMPSIAFFEQEEAEEAEVVCVRQLSTRELPAGSSW